MSNLFLFARWKPAFHHKMQTGQQIFADQLYLEDTQYPGIGIRIVLNQREAYILVKDVESPGSGGGWVPITPEQYERWHEVLTSELRVADTVKLLNEFKSTTNG